MRIAIAASCLISALTCNAIASTQSIGMQSPPTSYVANITNGVVPSEGQTAPNFSLPSQSGEQDTLSTFKGKWIVLYFYPEDFTSGCTLEAHNFQRDAGDYAKLNAVIVGVSVDSVDSHKQFCAKEGLNVKLLSDASRRVSAQYGSLNEKSQMGKRNTFLIDPAGKIAREWINVSPAQHSSEVLATIKAHRQA
jgi:peroxiredoxin Q/BCP